jgi:hypothetical protein
VNRRQKPPSLPVFKQFASLHFFTAPLQEQKVVCSGTRTLRDAGIVEGFCWPEEGAAEGGRATAAAYPSHCAFGAKAVGVGN